MNVKQLTISSFNDLEKIKGNERVIHLRKFVSKNILKIICSKCKYLDYVSIPEKIYFKSINSVKNSDVKIVVVKRNSGRPNLVEKLIQEKNMAFSMKFKSIDIKNKEVFV
ncbi:MAG: hypothetical protein QXM68_00230 [Candidatus Aenigmatarchaeota archaeon]|nr:hypothetical protein [Candidatus Aenigmarchaeota archaeon]